MYQHVHICILPSSRRTLLLSTNKSNSFCAHLWTIPIFQPTLVLPGNFTQATMIIIVIPHGKRMTVRSLRSNCEICQTESWSLNFLQKNQENSPTNGLYQQKSSNRINPKSTKKILWTFPTNQQKNIKLDHHLGNEDISEFWPLNFLEVSEVTVD